MKQKDIYEALKKKIIIFVDMPELGRKTQKISTFEMVCKAFAAQKLLNSVTHRVCKMRDFLVFGGKWRTCKKNCSFLESAAAATKFMGGES